MERLTKRDTDGQAMMDCEKCKADWTGKHGKPMVDCTALYCRNRLKNRLAAYEDTGLTPGEVHSMSGEWRTMMSVLNSIGGGYGRLRELAEADKGGRLVVLPCKPGDTVYMISWRLNGRHKIEERVFSLTYFDPAKCGKDYFLSREEAEKALEAMNDGNG
mgnify:CR=1 FL=1|jgi:hypothetical protein|uniref:Uncharacterized protein n=1 Tax=Podoviridae sp. ctDgT26 TaxID=2826547 RepID=A0A8S5LZQ6_9CAUD|nr:MAG TPA: hypothetical protein [Podoviridae sp. ctDgT26]